jgi:lysozyme
MKLSPQGLYFLAAHEGIVPAPYLDSVGVWTYGIGHAETSGLPPNPRRMQRGMPPDLDAELVRVFEVFAEDMEKFSADVNRAVTVPMEQHEFDAAVSFHFNTGAIGRATWVRSWNVGDKAAASREIMNWTKPPEITGRRRAEQRLWTHGDYGDKAVAVYGITSSNKPRYSDVRRRLSQDDVVRLMGIPSAARRAPSPAFGGQAPAAGAGRLPHASDGRSHVPVLPQARRAAEARAARLRPGSTLRPHDLGDA